MYTQTKMANLYPILSIPYIQFRMTRFVPLIPLQSDFQPSLGSALAAQRDKSLNLPQQSLLCLHCVTDIGWLGVHPVCLCRSTSRGWVDPAFLVRCSTALRPPRRPRPSHWTAAQHRIYPGRYEIEENTLVLTSLLAQWKYLLSAGCSHPHP